MDIYGETHFYMERQCYVFWNDVKCLESNCPFQSMLRQIDSLIPQNFVVKSVEDIRKICGTGTPCLYLEFMDRSRDMLNDFRADIYLYLCRYYHDPYIQQLVDIQDKKGGGQKAEEQGPDADKDVVQLARELQYNMKGLEELLSRWEKLLDENEIHAECFDDGSEGINQVESERYQNVLRMVVDLHGKMIMAWQMAVAWKSKAAVIREKLDGDTKAGEGKAAPAAAAAAAPEPNAAVKPSKKTQKPPNPQVAAKQQQAPRMKNVQKPTPPNSRRNPAKAERVTAKGSPAQSQSDLSQLDQSEAEAPAEGDAQPSTMKAGGDRAKESRDDTGQDEATNEAEGGGAEESAASQKPEIRMNRRQKKARPVVGGGAGAGGSAGQREDEAQEKRSSDPGAEGTAEDADDSTVTVTQLPELKAAGQRGKKKTDSGSGGSSRGSADSGAERERGGVKMPPIHGPNGNAVVEAAPPSEPDLDGDGGRPEIPPGNWQEKMLEKLHRKQKELRKEFEAQANKLKFNAFMKDRLAEYIAKYRGNYRKKRTLQEKVSSYAARAEEIHKNVLLLDEERSVLVQDLKLKIKVNKDVCRDDFIAKIETEMDAMNRLAHELMLGCPEHLDDLNKKTDTINKLLCFGLPADSDLEAELGYGLMGRYGMAYGYGFGDLGGSLPSLRSSHFLRDEDLLARGYRGRYDRAMWESMKWDAADRMSFMSLDDSSPYPYRGLDESYDSIKARTNPNPADDCDSPSQIRGDGDSGQSKYPQMYDQKRDEKQPPSFYPN